MDTSNLTALEAALRAQLAGSVRIDRLARALYATDASIYEIVPDAVVWPRSVADVAVTVRLCAEHGLPVTARGAGTGLTGAAVNRGVILDCSRHLNRILHVDPAARRARVEPGVVLDELNAVLKPHGLHFAPDVATGNRATLGGMIGNNSAGAHSPRYGRTVDHVLSLDVVLADGSLCRWGSDAAPPVDGLARRGDEVLAAVAREEAGEIAARFPKVQRSNAGYALDRLRVHAGRINTETILCGSEGTLGIVVGATLKLEPLPRRTGLVVAYFDDVLSALSAVSAVLAHRPAAVELIDWPILEAAARNPALAPRRWFVQREPVVLLVSELFDDDEGSLSQRLQALADDLRRQQLGHDHLVVTEPHRQADVWEIRKAGLGLQMSAPGDMQPCAFVEDTAVDPVRLRDYIAHFQQILAEEGVPRTTFYAHAGAGCLHVRPVLNLKQADDIAKLQRVALRVGDLARSFNGTISGEHGDGIVRSSFLERLYGPRIVAAFARIKNTFDPQHILNPGKIVDPLPFTENLRYGPQHASVHVPTMLDFNVYGGPAGLAQMCSGVGQCRQKLAGTMCPSYQATGDELHTPRARANALRLALSNRELITDLCDPALHEVMDFCLLCKACGRECPTGTDVAKLKMEWLAQRNLRHGVPRRSRFIADAVHRAHWGSRLAPLSNWIMQSRAMRAWLEHHFGLDRRIPPPRFARPTFRVWFARHERQHRHDDSLSRPAVVYFADTWTNFYQPRVGQAAVKVLEALGYRVLVPATVCCGRPLLSKGLLAEAKLLAHENVRILAPLAYQGLTIVGTEPSCVSAILDEWPQLVRTAPARWVAERTVTIEAFIARALTTSGTTPLPLGGEGRVRGNTVVPPPDATPLPSGGEGRVRGDAAVTAPSPDPSLEGRGVGSGVQGGHPQPLRFVHPVGPLLYHAHCHEKALIGTADALAVLRACTGGQGCEIDSGCCGMAGAFGHEVEHYDVARAIGEQRLFPAIRNRGPAHIAVSGFSCREHISHHTDAQPRHLIEYVAEAIE